MRLTSNLPDSVSIGGKAYAVHTGYKVWIGLFNAIKNGNEQEIFTLFANVFVDPLEVEANSMQEVVDALVGFIAGAKSDIQSDDTPSSERGAKYVYDYDYDANYIFGAFWQQYGIDLHADDLHFYKFTALFECLDENTRFQKIVGFRVADTSKIKDKDQKKHIEKMQKVFKLPLTAVEQEKYDAMQAEYLRIWGEDDD